MIRSDGPSRVQAWAARVERVKSVDDQVGPEIVIEVRRGIADELIDPSVHRPR